MVRVPPPDDDDDELPPPPPLSLPQAATANAMTPIRQPQTAIQRTVKRPLLIKGGSNLGGDSSDAAEWHATDDARALRNPNRRDGKTTRSAPCPGTPRTVRFAAVATNPRRRRGAPAGAGRACARPRRSPA